MSDQDNSPLEFSAFDLMPDWAQDTNKETSNKKQFKDHQGERPPRKGGGKFERRGGGGGRGNNNRNDRRGNNRGHGHSGGGRDFKNNRRQFSSLKGKVSATFEPTPEAIDSLAKHIQETARAFPVASLAKMVAGDRAHYQIRLKSGDKGPEFYQCRANNSVWLTKQEAIGNLIGSKKFIEEYYAIEEVELEAPKGNFAQIAVCGFSGEILGPPNHHEYQSSLARLHRDKFSNMTLERYKQRIKMETGEEIIAKWQEKVSKTFHYRLKSEMPTEEVAAVVEEKVETPQSEAPAEVEEEKTEATEAEVETTEEVVEEPTEAVEETTDATESEPAAEVEEAKVEPEPKAAAEETPAPSYTGPILKSIDELERHFSQNYADKAIKKTKTVVIPGNVPGKFLSPDVLQLIKDEGNYMRRGFPKDIFQVLCNKLDKGRSLKFFKRGKKALHVSMVRPKEIPANLSLTDRVQKIISMVVEKPGIKVFDVLEALCPDFKRPEKSKDNAELPKMELDDNSKAVLGDLRWLATEGYVIEFPDSKLELGRKPSIKLPPGASTFTIRDLKKRNRNRNRNRKPAANKTAKPAQSKAEPATPVGASTFVVK